jgi:hypothetical protein
MPCGIKGMEREFEPRFPRLETKWLAPYGNPHREKSMKRLPTTCPPDAHYLFGDLAAYIAARAAGDDDPDLLRRLRNPRQARHQDALTDWRRAPGSGWSNLRKA